MSEQIKKEENSKISINWNDISIPITVDIRKSISNLIYEEARNLIKTDATFVKEMLAHVLIDNRKTIVDLLKPVLQEMFDDNGFHVKVSGWWDEIKAEKEK
jgi:hypothetical protein